MSLAHLTLATRDVHKAETFFSIRRGTDVFKALALGARAVLLRRPYCWGLAVNDEQGVREVLLNLLADVELTLDLAGCASCADVSRDNVSRENP